MGWSQCPISISLSSLNSFFISLATRYSLLTVQSSPPYIVYGQCFIDLLSVPPFESTPQSHKLQGNGSVIFVSLLQTMMGLHQSLFKQFIYLSVMNIQILANTVDCRSVQYILQATQWRIFLENSQYYPVHYLSIYTERKIFYDPVLYLTCISAQIYQ